MKKYIVMLFLLAAVLMNTETTGPKLRIAVSHFEDKSQSYAAWQIGSGLSEMLITALFNSGKFTVFERAEMDKILAEQQLSQSGMVTPQTSLQIGQLLGVNYLVTGAVTEFINTASSGSTGINIRGISVGAKMYYAKVVIDLRIYDVTTGEIIAAVTTDGENSGAGLDLGLYRGPINFSTSKIEKSPVGKAAREAIEKAVLAISEKVGSGQWQGKVVTFKEGMVYINGGKNCGIKEGDFFIVEKPGEELIDPDTGLSLGSNNETIGKIKAVSVEEKYSICEVVIQASGSIFSAGYIVKGE